MGVGVSPRWVHGAGKLVYELVDPIGPRFVMQACRVGVNPTLTEEGMNSLGDRRALTPEWLNR
jgi:hypothetical protein